MNLDKVPVDILEYLPAFSKQISEEVQLATAALKQNGHTIRFIENPSEKLQLAAVNQNGYAIKHIKNPSEAVQLAAIHFFQ